ncbi:MAG TPA: glycine cleavage system protein GcvH [Allocoleopsis sp.]
MSREYPEHFKFLDTHEYVSLEGDTATIGISAFAIQELGDIVFIELPEVGTVLNKGDDFGSIESVKAVESMYAPMSGTVIEVNNTIIDEPEILSEDAYDQGWLIKLKINDPSELDGAMSADQYRNIVEGG